MQVFQKNFSHYQVPRLYCISNFTNFFKYSYQWMSRSSLRINNTWPEFDSDIKKIFIFLKQNLSPPNITEKVLLKLLPYQQTR